MTILCLLRHLQYVYLGKKWCVNKNIIRTSVDVTYLTYEPSNMSNKQIIVLHGLLGSKRNWDSMCKKLAAGTKSSVIAADARNHGDSPHSSSHTYLDLAADVSQLIKKLSIQKAHIIGHSMGGRTGMTLALTQPSKVASLVVVDISPIPTTKLTDNFFIKLVDVMQSVNFQKADNLSQAKEVAKNEILASGLVRNMEGMAFVLMNIGQLADKSFGWKCNLSALKEHFVNIASFPTELTQKQYLGPTLFIGGTRSDYLPKSHEPKIKVFFPKAQLKYIDNVGHNVHAENPTAFYKIVTDFLNELS